MKMENNRKTLNQIIFLLLVFETISCVSNIDCLKNHAINNPKKEYNSQKRVFPPEQYIEAIKKITISTYEERFKNGEINNFIIPSLSSLNTLFMLYDGATGKTKEQIGSYLNLDDSMFDYVEESNKVIRSSLFNYSNSLYSDVSQGLFVDSSLRSTLNEEYIELLTNKYYANIYHGNFDSSEISQLSSEYIENVTNGYLSNAFDDDYPSGNSRIIATSFIKTNWDDSGINHFQKIDRSYPFLNFDGTITQNLEYVGMHFEARYKQEEEYTLLGVPLYGSFSLNILLPNEHSDCLNIINKNVNALLSFNYDNSVSIEAHGYLPLFESIDSYYMNNVLSNAGIDDLLVDGEFGNIARSAIKLQAIQCGAGITINEFGINGIETKQAGKLNLLKSQLLTEEPILEFKIDCPFIYSISTDRDGIPLLVGQVVKL